MTSEFGSKGTDGAKLSYFLIAVIGRVAEAPCMSPAVPRHASGTWGKHWGGEQTAAPHAMPATSFNAPANGSSPRN